jgi:SPP1 gp7 family putative phage head morphogenesis protein
MATRTSNKILFDSSLRHQVDLRRLAKGQVKKTLSLLEKADRDLSARIRDRLAKFPQGYSDFRSERWKALLADIKAARAEALSAVRGDLTPDLKELATHEAAVEAKAIKAAIPVQVDFAAVSVSQLAAIATQKPFLGHVLGDWFKDLERKDKAGIQRALQLGMAQGESIPDIMRRIAGSTENAFRDGALAQTRRNLEAVTRTAVNEVSNAAREAMWDENADIVTALRWTATLDSRTTLICASRDGHLTPIGDHELPSDAIPLEPPGARPPAHFSCRSIMVAVLDGEEIAKTRPSVTPDKIGPVPAKTIYSDWLKEQSDAFQDDVLGPERADLFRSGKLTLDQFVDHSGKEYTLDQLKGLKR